MLHRRLLRCALSLTFLAFFTVMKTGLVNAQNRVYVDPEDALKNADFAVQGEYEGRSRGMQVVAQGNGEFSIVIYEGGLPGAGWNGTDKREFDGDADVVQQLVTSMELQKVHRKSPTEGAAPPPGAVYLFDGTRESLEEFWKSGARLSDDGLLMQGATTNREFRDYVLHLEFRIPFMPNASGQQRGNSGLYHQGRYENQILDSFGLGGTKNETGAIYDIKQPDVNVCYPPLSWQTYDVIFTAATYDELGNKLTDARVTTRLNGVVVQNEVSVPSPTRAAPLGESDSGGPIYLQDHGNPVRFRNIWILPRDAQREARRPIIPGFERFYGSSPTEPATAEEVTIDSLAVGGEILISALGCTNCHAEDALVWQASSGPQLTTLASRVRADFVLDWIKGPHQRKPGTTMPDVLAHMDDNEKSAAAEALASYLLIAGDSSGYVDRVGDATAADRGEELYHSIGCVACHPSRTGNPTPKATSVPIGTIDTKYTLNSLTAFLQNPHMVRPSGRMPKLVADAGEARDIATYLLRDTVVVPGAQQFLRTVFKGSWDRLPDFSSLQPVGEATTVSGLGFDGINPLDRFGAVYHAFLPIEKSDTYSFTLGSDDGSRLLINDTEVVRVDGIHPYQQKMGKIDLSPGVHRIRVEYFEQGGEEKLTLQVEGGDIVKTDISTLVTQDPEGEVQQNLVQPVFVADPDLVEEGRRLFVSTGCANCHEMREHGQAVASKLETRDLQSIRSRTAKGVLQGCLADRPPAGVPDYQLSSKQQQAVRSALASVIPRNEDGRPTDNLNVHATLAAANCYACHVNDGLGGPEYSRDAFFETTTPEMGNEGRLPPPLTGVADKLNDKFIEKYLENGANERPYMKTRMPGFGYLGLRSLHHSMRRVDRITGADLPDVQQSAGRLKADGRTLVGNDGLACVKCHTFNGESTPGIQAIDMLKMTDRLRKDWFHRYLRDPQKYRPGTRMPASFPDGVSVLKTIADGQPGYQIEAVWEYLKDGKSAKVPAGLRPGAIELVPANRPVIYRNFLSDLNPRGIAVGYPEGVHLAWDAETMSLRKVWQNQFLDASLHWQGRGPGNLSPLGDLVQVLDASAPVAMLDSMEAVWPEKTDDSSGYKFRGYKLDKLGRPAFKYSLGEITVTEEFVPGIEDDGDKSITRVISTSGGSGKNVVFRLAVGDIQPQEDGWFLVNQAYRTKAADTLALKLVTINGQSELRGLSRTDQPSEVTQIIRW